MTRWLALISLGCTLAFALPQTASAHTSEIVAPGDLMHHWVPDPVVVIGALIAGALYLLGNGRLREVGRHTGRGPIISPLRVACFWSGLVVLLIALASPLDTATATVFSAHMIQHVLLIAVAPPLILLGNPLAVMMNGLPRSWRRPLTQLPHRIPGLDTIIRTITQPVVAFLLHLAAVWFWHVPSLYDAAVQSERIHFLEHLSFVATAFCYWWAIIPMGGRARHTISPPLGILSVFAMGMQGVALGAILTFSGSVIYPVYLDRSDLWGISALSDQRLAGLIMWIPAGSVYVAIALVLLATWFRRDEAPTSTPAGPALVMTSSTPEVATVPVRTPSAWEGRSAERHLPGEA